MDGGLFFFSISSECTRTPIAVLPWSCTMCNSKLENEHPRANFCSILYNFDCALCVCTRNYTRGYIVYYNNNSLFYNFPLLSVNCAASNLRQYDCIIVAYIVQHRIRGNRHIVFILCILGTKYTRKGDRIWGEGWCTIYRIRESSLSLFSSIVSLAFSRFHVMPGIYNTNII